MQYNVRLKVLHIANIQVRITPSIFKISTAYDGILYVCMYRCAACFLHHHQSLPCMQVIVCLPTGTQPLYIWLLNLPMKLL